MRQESAVVLHTMKDGNTPDSVEGYAAPLNPETETVYRLLAEAPPSEKETNI